MTNAEAQVGMLVRFGDADGEQTLGRVLKLNPARAKIEALQPRNGRAAETKWNVPYPLIQSADNGQAPAS